MCIDAKLSAGPGVLPMVFLCVTAYAPEDSAVYKEHCAQCHDKGVQRAPQLAALKALSPEKILDALTNGKIAEQGKALTAAEARAVAVFASGKRSEPWKRRTRVPAPAFRHLARSAGRAAVEWSAHGPVE